MKKEADKFSQSFEEEPFANVVEPIEDNDSDEEVVNEQQTGGEEEIGFSNGVSPGDTIYVRYLNEPKKILRVTLSEQTSDPSRGIVGIFEPLGETLLGSEEGDEIDVLIGSHLRRAVVEKVERERDASDAKYAASEHNGAPDQRTRRINERSSRSDRDADAGNSRDDEFGTNALEKDTVRQHPRLKPDAFYDADYRFTLRDLAVGIIDRFGPITHRHLCQKIARLHGFQRTGSQIRRTVWAAVHKERQVQKVPSGANIFWPRHQTPQEVLEFRGLEFDGDERAWKQVPHPEKLDLALEAISTRNRRDSLTYVLGRLGLGRLTVSTRTELEELLSEAERAKIGR